MAKSDLRKEQLKKAAKRRASRPAPKASASPQPSKSNRAMELVVSAVLDADHRHADLSDRLLLAALRSVHRGSQATDPMALDVQQRVTAACQGADLDPRSIRTAVEELLAVVESYDGRSPRAALTYLHSIAN